MIYIDTDHLQTLVLNLETANRQIDEATNLLLQITTHENWGCAERVQINEYILENRKMIQNLQSKATAFHNIVKQVTDEFVETEDSIGNMFGQLESMLAQFMSIVQTVSAPITEANVVNRTSKNGISIFDSISVIDLDKFSE